MNFTVTIFLTSGLNISSNFTDNSNVLDFINSFPLTDIDHVTIDFN